MVFSRRAFWVLLICFCPYLSATAVSDLILIGLDEEREIHCIDLSTGHLVKKIPVQIKPWDIMGFNDDIYVINFRDRIVHRYPYEGGEMEIIPLDGRPIGLVCNVESPYVVLEPESKERKNGYVGTLFDLHKRTFGILPNGDYRFTNHDLFIKRDTSSTYVKYDLNEQALDEGTYYTKNEIGLINGFNWCSIFYPKSVGYGNFLRQSLVINTVDQESTIACIDGKIIRQIIPYSQGIILLLLSRIQGDEPEILPVSINPDAPRIGSVVLASKSVLCMSLYWGEGDEATILGEPFPEYKHPHQAILDEESESGSSGSYVEPEPARISSEEQ